MKEKLPKTLADFMRAHWAPGQRLLLGLSGGPDSLALLHLLLNYAQQIHPTTLPLELAHVDHRWRAESSAEAEQLAQLATQLNLPFHLKTLDPTQLTGNLEDACRQERLNFFKRLSDDQGCYAVLLGHHADDQAETVLKRLFEGASLPYLGGLKSENMWEGLRIWRPLLSCRKSDILAWLKTQQLTAFDDATNRDVAYMRGRMRAQILPTLTEQFGKEISTALCAIGWEAQELYQYLQERIAPYLDRVERSENGLLLDFSEHSLPALLEVKHIVRLVTKEMGFQLSKEGLANVSELILSGKANKQVSVGSTFISVDRKRLFVWKHLMADILDRRPLQEGVFQQGSWKISVTNQDQDSLPIVSRKGWKQVWRGYLEVTIPQGTYFIGEAVSQAPYHQGGTIDKWWTDHKVPACFRKQVPVIWRDGEVYEEFLTVSLNPPLKDGLKPCYINEEKWIRIIMERSVSVFLRRS